MNLKTLLEIQEVYGISVNTTRGAIRRGDIEARKVGGVIWQVDTDNEKFKTWLANLAKPGRGPKKKAGDNERDRKD